MDKPTTKKMQIIIDNREQRPYRIPNAKRATLSTGDYSIEGFEDLITIERKSKEDAYNTIGGGRKRFVRELERMKNMEYSAIVIESTLEDFAENPPSNSRLSPSSAVNSLIAWSIRYGVHIIFAGSRAYAHQITVRILEKFYKEFYKESKNKR